MTGKVWSSTGQWENSQTATVSCMSISGIPNRLKLLPDTPIIDPELTWDTTTATEIDITGDPIVIQTDGMRIEISRTPCRMTVMQADGTTLFWDCLLYTSRCV